jgi:CDP-diacylglycerol--glycerol-3-phosphate 3-phosphatidyltransferase
MKYFIHFLTLLRLFAGPLIFLLIIVVQNFGLSLIIFILASLSDYFDGLLARKYNLESELGEVMDPIADKVLTLFLIMALVAHLQSPFIAFLGALILAREFWVSALRSINSRNGRLEATKVTFLAKIKTLVQFCAFGFFLASIYLNNNFIEFIAYFILFSSFIIAYQTALSYTIATFRR